ncbi:MAG: flagellar basal body P-ring protein FlgI [Planctomycetaceae bacterium]
MHDRAHGPLPLASTDRLARVLLAMGLPLLVGCAGSAIRSQSPEIEALSKLEAGTRLVGDYAVPAGMGMKRIERAALITGLANTGSDPPPGPQRQTLLADMQARGVVDPNRLLAASSTSLAWVHGWLPPAVRKGDRFDVFVEVPPDNDTTSIAGGWLMETRLAEMAVLGNVIRDGHELGVTMGPLLVDPVAEGTRDSKSKLRARIPGGGVALVDREIGLALRPEHRSFAMSKRIGDWINRRFHAVVRGTKRGVATPKTDRYVALEVPTVYRHNIPRFMRVVQCVAVIEPPEGRHSRLQLLSRQLADPVTAPTAALRLEAMGKESVPVLRQALDSKDATIRFVAAEALAYLGESVAAPKLAEAATTLRSARPAALAALGVLDDAHGIDALRSLLSGQSAETRYGAFRALWRIDPEAPLVRGERLGDACSMHMLDVKGPPLVHVTRSTRPEIVFFGTEHPLADGLRAEAGPCIVVVVDGAAARISRFAAGESDRVVDAPATADEVVRAIVEAGGTYPDAVQFLQQASARQALGSRLACDALPTEWDGRGDIHEEASQRARDIPADDAGDSTASARDGAGADGSS